MDGDNEYIAAQNKILSIMREVNFNFPHVDGDAVYDELVRAMMISIVKQSKNLPDDVIAWAEDRGYKPMIDDYAEEIE